MENGARPWAAGEREPRPPSSPPGCSEEHLAATPLVERGGAVRGVSAGRQPPAVAVGAEGQPELPADLFDAIGREEVVAQPADATVADVEAGDGAHGLAVVVLVPGEEQGLAAARHQLEARWGRVDTSDEARLHAAQLRGAGHALAAEEHAAEDLGLPRTFDGGAHDLDGGVIEEERRDAGDVASVEGVAEG